MGMNKWTKEQLTEHIKVNVKDYGAAIVVAALYKKIYGEFPSIGLSGFQAGGADSIIEVMPESESPRKTDTKGTE
jgi:hypothetical protein